MSEVMKFDLKNKDGILLDTENKYCTQKIKVVPKLMDVTFTENTDTDTYHDVPEGYAGYGKIKVDVCPNLATLNVTANGTYDEPPEGAYGFGEVIVNVPEPMTIPLTVTENDTYSVPGGYDGYGTVTVNVSLDSSGICYTRFD